MLYKLLWGPCVFFCPGPIVCLSRPCIYHTMPPTNKNSVFLSPISIFEIESILNETKVKYSNYTYNLNMSVIKEIRVEITPILFHLFNRSLSEGIFPIALKKAKVIPLFKDGDRSKPENYRPISLLPQFSKLLEKLIKVRNLKFLNKFNIISDT